MTPSQRIKKAIIERAEYFSKNGMKTQNVTVENVDQLYDAFWEETDCADWMQDAEADIRCGEHETGIDGKNYNRYFEDKEVAMEIDGVWVGWTYYFGGGKHSEPEAVDWIDNAYEIKMETKMMPVLFFSRVEE